MKTSVPFLICCALLLAPKASEAKDPIEVVVINRKTVEFQLPGRKPALKTLDPYVRVALCLPKARNPVVYLVGYPSDGVTSSERYWAAGYRVREAHYYEAVPADRYEIDLNTPFYERLTKIIQRLFPRTTVYQPGESPASEEELQLRPEVAAEFIEGEGTLYKGMKIHISLIIADKEGNQLSVVEAKSSDLVRRTIYWTINGAWAGITSRALGEAFDQLAAFLPTNRALKGQLTELAKDRELPAGLVTSVGFNDDRSFFPNGILDAGDTGRLLVHVVNHGPGPAYSVVIRGTSDLPEISISGEQKVGDLSPGEVKDLVVNISGGIGLPTSAAKLRVETSEKRGYGAQPILLQLPTRQLVYPQLEIVDVTLNDRPSDRSRGDGDGQPANGETLEVIVRVRNAGQGDAAGVAVTMASPKVAAEILEGKAVIPLIPVDQVEEARLLFRLPISLQVGELPLSFQAIEARGAQVASANKEQLWKLRAKHPGVELSYRLYDGNSTGSAGNRDGLVNNGERIEVSLTPNNRGDLPARDVKISIESEDPALVPRPAILEIGDLPVQAEGSIQRFAFDVPRVYNRDQATHQLRFNLSISQKDFPLSREPLGLSFVRLRPTLSLEKSIPTILSRGAGGEIVLRLRNSGTLRAEDVALEVTAETAGVDLLDERGVPVPLRKISYGALEPQEVAQEQRLRINVRRNAPIGTALMRFAILQRDFPGLVKQVELSVSDEPAAVVTVATPAEPTRANPAPSTAGAPASISFLRNTAGEHLISEAIVLRFEVQSSSGMAEVRLTQNDRLVSLDAAQRTSSMSGGLQAEQYEVLVRLEEGENQFEVVAVTRQGLRSARSLKLIRDRDSGRLWVVAIGVGRFADPTIQGLQYPEADAQAMYNYFRDTFGLPDSQVFLRTNEQATLREVKSVLGTQLVARANDPRDTVILYFAGHGMRDRLAGSLDPDGLSKYFLPFDSVRNDLYSTALDMDEVTNILRRLTPERVIVILDTCFSGAAGGRSPFDPKSDRERAPISSEFLDRMAHVGKGRVVLTASGPEEAAQESSEFGHGVFTYFLLEGLRGAADLNGDGNIDVHEVYGYVSEKVVRTTKGRQNPKLKEPDLVGQILIGRGAVRSGH